MCLQNRIFKTVAISFIFAAAAVSAAAQGDPPRPAEASFEAVLYVLAAGGQSAQGDAVPSSLNAISREIRAEFGSANLRVINTYFGRLSSMGNLDYKGVSNAYAPEAMPGSPSFLDWRLTGIRIAQIASGQPAFQLQSFRFGARVPVRAGNFADEKAPAPINYEAIGLTVERVSVRENVPTLIGTLVQPRTDGTLFLVLTVRNADK
ncbi:MAG: hypothetical protein AB7Q37_09760 [Pyrinomonadaceae bacterium]